MLVYFFPPVGGIGAQRTLRYIKYLKEYGWRLHVLTVDTPTRTDHELYRDMSLLSEIPAGISVSRTGLIDLTLIPSGLNSLGLRRLSRQASRFVNVLPPDHCLGWLPFAFRKARKMIRKEHLDAVYTVSSPYTTHLIGYLLKRSLGIPWVADFRDEWSQNRWRQPLFEWQRSLDRWLEHQVLTAADHVVACTPSYTEEMSTLLAPRFRKKFHTITNGFDGAEFARCRQQRGQKNNNKFTVAYAGMFYGDQQPTWFLEAVEGLVERGLLPTEDLELVFAGMTRDETFRRFETGPLGKAIKRLGSLPHSEAIQCLMASDLLLFIASTSRGSGNIPGKTFEYIATGKPILALATQGGEAADLLRQSNTAVAIVEPENVEAIGKAVLDVYAAWKGGTLQVEPNWSSINQLESRPLTERLSEVLYGAIAPATPPTRQLEFS